MSLLDQLFGTDGRNKKDEGIWNWIKNQKIKSKGKSKNKHLMLTRSLTSTPPESSPTYAGSSLSTICTSVPASSSVSYASFTCSPSSPTASFKPSSSSPSPVPTPSPTFTESRSSTPATLNMPASPTSSTSSSSSSTPSPINFTRQRTQSAFVSSTHPFASSSSSFGEGPIKRSISSRSTPSRSAPAQVHHSNSNIDHSRSLSHGDLDNQGRLVKGSRPVGGMDDISETATVFFHNGDSEDETTTIGNRSMQQRQQRWSSPSDEREHARRAEMRKARNDGWWWE